MFLSVLTELVCSSIANNIQLRYKQKPTFFEEWVFCLVLFEEVLLSDIWQFNNF